MKTNSQKCVIISDTATYFFILIDHDKNDNPFARLPYKDEVPPKILQTSEVTAIKEDFLLINTHTEIDPFEIFPNFTTADDYGFINFKFKSEGFSSYRPDAPEDKKEYIYWDILRSDDKKLVEDYLLTRSSS